MIFLFKVFIQFLKLKFNEIVEFCRDESIFAIAAVMTMYTVSFVVYYVITNIPCNGRTVLIAFWPWIVTIFIAFIWFLVVPFRKWIWGNLVEAHKLVTERENERLRRSQS